MNAVTTPTGEAARPAVVVPGRAVRVTANILGYKFGKNDAVTAITNNSNHRRSLTIVSKKLGIALDASNLSANAESVPQPSVEVQLTGSVGETIDTTQPSWAPAAYVARCVVFVCILQHIKVCARPHVAPSVHKQSFPPAVKRTIVSPSPDVYVWLNSTYIIRIWWPFSVLMPISLPMADMIRMCETP
jgi:hypothetical protein